MAPAPPTPTHPAIANNPPLGLETFGVIFGILSGFVSALAGAASWWVIRKVCTQINITTPKILKEYVELNHMVHP